MPLPSKSAAATSLKRILDRESPIPRTRGASQSDRQDICDAMAEWLLDVLGDATVTGNCPPGTAGGPLANGRIT